MPETSSLVDLNDEEELRSLYRLFKPYHSYSSVQGRHRAFIRSLQTQVADPAHLKSVGWCARCDAPEHESTMLVIFGGRKVCSSCAPWYAACTNCDRAVLSSSRHRTLDIHDRVCQSCFNTRYRYCNSCDGYYNRSNRDEHSHDESNSCCTSPQQRFKIPNNGNGLLDNDTRVTVQLAAGEISTEGIELIRAVLRDHANTFDWYEQSKQRRDWLYLATEDLNELGSKWQTRQGNYTKRLSRVAYKKRGIKVPPAVLTRIGNIASDHSTAVDFNIETTRKLNMSATRFGHRESCWWQSYYASRCVFKTNGGFGLRAFDGSRVVGRAWVMPLKLSNPDSRAAIKTLVPTFETENAAAYVVFNGYGVLNGYTPARMLSYMIGGTYAKIEFSAQPMHVNASSGYLVGPEELVAPYTDGRLYLSVDQHSNLYNREQREKELTNA